MRDVHVVDCPERIAERAFVRDGGSVVEIETLEEWIFRTAEPPPTLVELGYDRMIGTFRGVRVC